jgi:hypothetical protein
MHDRLEIRVRVECVEELRGAGVNRHVQLVDHVAQHGKVAAARSCPQRDGARLSTPSAIEVTGAPM